MILLLLVAISNLLGASTALRIQEIQCSASSVTGSSVTLSELCGDASVTLGISEASNPSTTLKLYLSSLGPTIGLNQLEGFEPHIKKIATVTIPQDYNVMEPFPLTPSTQVQFPPECGNFFLVAVVESKTEGQTFRSSDSKTLRKTCGGGSLSNLNFTFTLDGFSKDSIKLTEDGSIEADDIVLKVVNKGQDVIASRTTFSAPTIMAKIVPSPYGYIQEFFNSTNFDLWEFSRITANMNNVHLWNIYWTSLKGLETVFVKEDLSGSIVMTSGSELEVNISRLELPLNDDFCHHSQYVAEDAILVLSVSDGNESYSELNLPLKLQCHGYARRQMKDCFVLPDSEDSGNAVIISSSNDVTFYDGQRSGFRREYMDSAEMMKFLQRVITTKEKTSLLMKLKGCPNPPLEDGDPNELVKNSFLKDVKDLVTMIRSGIEAIEVKEAMNLEKNISTKFLVLVEKILEEILNSDDKARQYLLSILVSAYRNSPLVSQTISRIQNFGVTSDITDFLMGGELPSNCGQHGGQFDYGGPMMFGQPNLYTSDGSYYGSDDRFPDIGFDWNMNQEQNLIFPESDLPPFEFPTGYGSEGNGSTLVDSDIKIHFPDFPDDGLCDTGEPCFPCENGKTIPINWVCDNVHDCKSAADEAQCNVISKRSIPEKELDEMKKKTEKSFRNKMKKSRLESELSKRSASFGNSFGLSLENSFGLSLENSPEGFNSLEGRAEAGIGTSGLPGQAATPSRISDLQEMIRQWWLQLMASFMANQGSFASPFTRRNMNIGPTNQNTEGRTGQGAAPDLETVNPFMASVLKNIQTAVADVTGSFNRDRQNQRRQNFKPLPGSSQMPPSSGKRNRNWHSPPPRTVPKQEQDSLRALLQLYILLTSSQSLTVETLSEYSFISVGLRQALVDFFKAGSESQQNPGLFGKAWIKFFSAPENSVATYHFMMEKQTLMMNLNHLYPLNDKVQLLMNSLKFLKAEIIPQSLQFFANELDMKAAMTFTANLSDVFLSVLESTSMNNAIKKVDPFLLEERERNLLNNFPGSEPTLKNYCDKAIRSYMSSTMEKEEEERSSNMAEEMQNPFMEFNLTTVNRQPKSVYWTQYDGSIFSGERSKLLGINYWKRTAMCNCQGQQMNGWGDYYTNMQQRSGVPVQEKSGSDGGTRRRGFLRKGNSQNHFVLGQNPRRDQKPTPIPSTPDNSDLGAAGSFGLPQIPENNFDFGIPPVKSDNDDTRNVNKELFEAIIFPQSQTSPRSQRKGNMRSRDSSEPRLNVRLAGETVENRGSRKIVGGLVVVEAQDRQSRRRIFGTICNDGWTPNEAAVVCKIIAERYELYLKQSLTLAVMKDFMNVLQTTHELSYIPSILLANVTCPVDAPNLESCDSAGWGVSGDCFRYNWAGVRCVLDSEETPAK